KKVTPEFSRYCAEHQLNAEVAAREAMYSDPADFLFLGRSGDKRAVPVLERALKARNYMIVAQAALGLGRLGDKNAIPSILDAARAAPAEVSALIARGLLFFDDPKVLAEAERLIGNKRFVDEFRKALREKGPEAVQ